MIQLLKNFFIWIYNHTEQDKLLHKGFGEIFFFLTYIVLFLCGISNCLSLALSLIVVALIGLLKEYIFDPIATEGNKPDIKDALWTILGGIEIFIVTAIIYNIASK